MKAIYCQLNKISETIPIRMSDLAVHAKSKERIFGSNVMKTLNLLTKILKNSSWKEADLGLQESLRLKN